jgi:exopolysaccharide production protein ExoZ
MAAWTVLIIGQSYYWMPLGYHPILLSLSMLEFLLGCLGALLVLAFRPRISPVWLWVVATGCLAIGVIDSGEVLIGSHHNIRNFALPYLALIVVGAGCELGGMRRFPGVLMLLGNASYSIYLSHYYLIWDLNGRVGSNPLVVGVLGRDGARILVCVLVLTLGVICWALIERPLHALARRISRRSRRPVSATTAGGS